GRKRSTSSSDAVAEADYASPIRSSPEPKPKRKPKSPEASPDDASAASQSASAPRTPPADESTELPDEEDDDFQEPSSVTPPFRTSKAKRPSKSKQTRQRKSEKKSEKSEKSEQADDEDSEERQLTEHVEDFRWSASDGSTVHFFLNSFVSLSLIVSIKTNSFLMTGHVVWDIADVQ